MKAKEKPIFQNDLSKEEQAKQNIAFEKEQEAKEKADKTWNVLDAAATVIDILSNK